VSTIDYDATVERRGEGRGHHASRLTRRGGVPHNNTLSILGSQLKLGRRQLCPPL
ncbi:hypothetical protein J6590_040386, partial [Homalodisca vitripennis]